VLVAVANLKGGCGKSNIAVNLACALFGKRTSVVFVDADAQGTGTFHASKGLLPVMCESLPLEADAGVAAWVRRILALKGDFVVIDAPPHVGAVTQAIIGVVDLVLVPVTPSAADLVATGRAIELIRKARKLRSDGGPKCLMLPSRVDSRTVAGRELAGALETFGEPVGPTIHQRAVFVDAMSSGQWVGDFAPGSDAHNDIIALSEAVKKGRI